MIVICLAIVMIVLAYKVFRSYFVKVLAGFTTITAGIVRIADYPDDWEWLIFGVVFVVMGIYILLMVAHDLIKGG